MNELYSAVLDDLTGRKTRLEGELREIDSAISAIHKVSQSLNESRRSPNRPPALPFEGMPAESERYARISVRWSVLWHLADFSNEFEKTGEIATALRKSGHQSKGPNFGNMVSAVLSMMKSKGEVETNSDGGYRITEAGRTTWASITQGQKFRDAMSGAMELKHVE